MPSHIYQNVISLVVNLPTTRGPSVFINNSMKEHRALNQIFDVTELTTLTPLSQLFSHKLSFQIVDFKTNSLPHFALKSSNSICIWYL